MLLLSCLLGLLMVAACTTASEAVVPTSIPSPTPQAIAEIKTLPTPAPLDQMVVYDDLQVVMSEAEITTSYLTEYGSEREPSAGQKSIWIHILLKNISQGRVIRRAIPHHPSLLHNNHPLGGSNSKGNVISTAR